MKCTQLLKAQALQTRDTKVVENCAAFTDLSETPWNAEVSHQARRSLYERKRNTMQRIPFTEDMQKLNSLLC